MITRRESSSYFSQVFVARQWRTAWMRGTRWLRDEGMVDTMSSSETVVQRSRQAVIRCRSRRFALLVAGTIVYFTAVSTIPQTDLRYTLPFAPMYAVALAASLRAKRGPSYTKPV